MASNLLIFLRINLPQGVKSTAKFGGLATISGGGVVPPVPAWNRHCGWPAPHLNAVAVNARGWCHVTSTLMLENLACSLLSSLSALVIAAPWPQIAEAELAEAEAAVAEAVVAPAAWARSAAQQLSDCGRESSVNAARRHVRSTSDSILSSRRVLIPHTHTDTQARRVYTDLKTRTDISFYSN